MQTGYRFQATDLHQFVNTLFIQLGSSPTEASLVADHLVAANLAGHDSHGWDDPELPAFPCSGSSAA